MPSGNPVLDSATRKSLKAPVFNNLYEKRAWMLEHMAGVLRIFGRKGYNEGCAGHVTIVDRANYPILIHSNKGKHRVGVVVGIIRKLLQGWSTTGIYQEYDIFSGGLKGQVDLEFITMFDTELIVRRDHLPDFVKWER